MTTTPSTLYIHRLLDQAYSGVEMTPEAQDLKEEMRADLTVRAAELEASGLSPEAAAQRAIADLGDIESIVDEMQRVVGPASPWLTQRVRPRPAFVVRTVVLVMIALGALGGLLLGVAGRSVPRAALAGSVALLAVVAGIVVADSLRQETTGNFPVPRGRAAGYGLAALVGVGGVAAAVVYLPDRKLPWLVAGGLAIVISVVWFTYLGVTQTNRHKPWVVRLQNEHAQAGDRFSRDPVAAARFGIYTVVIWIVALAAFVALTVAFGWAWSWLALVGGLVGFFVTLARMLFAPETRSTIG
jgi:hypothetical protein